MEKNMAPKWMEGHYLLNIHGNRVDLVCPRGLNDVDTYTARCHPDDKFAIEDAITKLFTDIKRDKDGIKVGDTVTTSSTCGYNLYAQWVDRNVKGADKCRCAYGQPVKSGGTYKVLAIAPHGTFPNTDLAYIQRGYSTNGECYLVDVDALEKVKA